jgi:hypothetical protein
MTPIEVTRQMLGHLGLTEEQLYTIRDLVDIQADIVVRGYLASQKVKYDELHKGEIRP